MEKCHIGKKQKRNHLEQEGPGSLLARKQSPLPLCAECRPSIQPPQEWVGEQERGSSGCGSDQDANPSSATLEPSISLSEIGGDNKSYFIKLLRGQYGTGLLSTAAGTYEELYRG